MEGLDTFAALAATYVSPGDADHESHTSRYDDEDMVYTVEAAGLPENDEGQVKRAPRDRRTVAGALANAD